MNTDTGVELLRALQAAEQCTREGMLCDDACDAAAAEHGVDSNVLYRLLTDKAQGVAEARALVAHARWDADAE